MKENTLILVDGTYYLYRSYYSFPLMMNELKEPTGAMYGVLNILKSILLKYSPSHVAVVFDKKGKTFRNNLFENYKNHRPSMPKDLCSQINPLHSMIKAMGLQIVSITGVEADDVIGTLAFKSARIGHNVVIMTSDKDMAQLVSSKIVIFNTMSNSILGIKEIKMKFGVFPDCIIDYLALVGDRSDNIPGIPGIGKKTAQVLLSKIGVLKILYQKLEHIRTLNIRGAQNIIYKLEKYRDIAFISYKLASIKTDVKINLSYNQLKVKEPNIEMLTRFCRNYGFKHWINDLQLRL